MQLLCQIFQALLVVDPLDPLLGILDNDVTVAEMPFDKLKSGGISLKLFSKLRAPKKVVLVLTLCFVFVVRLKTRR